MADEDKTEKPTERRLSDAREKGDIARSKDLTAALGIFLTVIMFTMYIPYLGKSMVTCWHKYFTDISDFTITHLSIYNVGKDIFSTFLKLTLPVFLLLIVVDIMMEILQTGGLRFITSNIRIKWEKVFFFNQIISGLKKILFSHEALMELFKSIVKVIAIGAVAYFAMRAEIPAIMALPATPLPHILEVMGKIFLKLSFDIAILLLIFAGLDFLWQKYRYTKKLKMSKHDIKDEFKNTEGDPQIKGRQKKIQYQWAMRRMMAQVPQADVVITNPTHYAVALKYEFKKMKSPQLIAKGVDLIALRIRDIAKENKIPVVENPPVARALYAAVELNAFIPNQLFKPVAEILAYIYKLKGKRVR